MDPVLLFHVDAFAARPFSGNPAAVCLLKEVQSDAWMQNLASEMNLSETAFVYPDERQLRLRWMTPATEVDLCGHATLAAAHVIRELASKDQLPGFLKPHWSAGSLQFITLSGVLTAEFPGEDGIVLDFPAVPNQPAEAPAELLQGLRLAPEQVVYCGRTSSDFLVQVQHAAEVRKLMPDMSILAAVPVRGVAVTALGDAADHDFISRFFAPACGVNEDPVTGSAHCALAVYWAPRFGRQTLFGYQASARGGRVKMELFGERVRLSGKAVTIVEGQLTPSSQK